MWSAGIDDWTSAYELRLKTWLQAMEGAEGMTTDSLPFKLSAYMRESWASGRFWLNYAARKSWAFDTIFWRYLDEKFFGLRDKEFQEHELWRTRIDLLGEEEKGKMELFVQRKMTESKGRILVDGDPAEAKKVLYEVQEGI